MAFLGLGDQFMKLNVQVSEETGTQTSEFWIRIAWQASSPEIPVKWENALAKFFGNKEWLHYGSIPISNGLCSPFSIYYPNIKHKSAGEFG